MTLSDLPHLPLWPGRNRTCDHVEYSVIWPWLRCLVGLHNPYEHGRAGRILALRCRRCDWAGTGWDGS